MHASEILDAAAQITTHAPALVTRCEQLSDSALTDYWLASKCRLDRWGADLRRLRSEKPGDDVVRGQQWWRHFFGTAIEIYGSEVLTRVWSAVAQAHDQRHHQQEAEPVARSVLVGHLEARHRVLSLIAAAPASYASGAHQLNQARHRCERWSDMLLGYLMATHDSRELCFDTQRATDFAASIARQHKLGILEKTWEMTLGSLRRAFRSCLAEASPNPELNRRVVQSVIACFPPDLFDPTNTTESLWLLRVGHLTEDAHCMVEQLLALDRPELAG